MAYFFVHRICANRLDGHESSIFSIILFQCHAFVNICTVCRIQSYICLCDGKLYAHKINGKHLSCTMRCKYSMTHFLSDTTLSMPLDRRWKKYWTEMNATRYELGGFVLLLYLSKFTFELIRIFRSCCFCLHRMSIYRLIVLFAFDFGSVLIFVSLTNRNRCRTVANIHFKCGFVATDIRASPW